MYRCTYTIRIIFLYARIHLHLYLHNTCIQNTHITLFCHVVVVVFFIVVFIEMTILYTMIIVNSHYYITSFLNLWFRNCIFYDLIFMYFWFDLIFDWMGWDLSVYLMIDKFDIIRLWYQVTDPLHTSHNCPRQPV